MSTISAITFPFIDSALHYQTKFGVALDQQSALEEQGIRVLAPGDQAEKLPLTGADIDLTGRAKHQQAIII